VATIAAITATAATPAEVAAATAEAQAIGTAYILESIGKSARTSSQNPKT
jgi:hypothetical protein